MLRNNARAAGQTTRCTASVQECRLRTALLRVDALHEVALLVAQLAAAESCAAELVRGALEGERGRV